jgi:CDP-glucose 4,6-dehydratase
MNDFYRSKSIFITGHTGFKGAWLCRILQSAGAHITGYALEPEIGAIFNEVIDLGALNSVINDIRDFRLLKKAFDEAQPEIVFHLAAQPLVLDAYEQPAYTFETNVQGTVNLLECVRLCDCVRSVVVVTTDKVYRNIEKAQGYQEEDTLGGNEPYSASKACAEFAANAYAESFLFNRGVALSTARAGNVIGGGDIAGNRIIPDCIRSAKRSEDIIVRNPQSVRPYQHVLEPLFAYLLIARRQLEDTGLSGSYNIGPYESDCIKTSELADIFCREWGNGQSWKHFQNAGAPHESRLLMLDCKKMQTVFGWHPLWDVKKAIAMTVEWEKAENKLTVTDKQINEYAKEFQNEG